MDPKMVGIMSTFGHPGCKPGFKRILGFVPEELKRSLSGSQIGSLMLAIESAYYEGRDSMGAEVYSDRPAGGAVRVNCLNKIINWKMDKEEIFLSIS